MNENALYDIILPAIQAGLAAEDLNQQLHKNSIPTSGQDSTRAVCVQLAPTGALEGITIAHWWQQSILPSDLAAAITEALTAAQATQLAKSMENEHFSFNVPSKDCAREILLTRVREEQIASEYSGFGTVDAVAEAETFLAEGDSRPTLACASAAEQPIRIHRAGAHIVAVSIEGSWATDRGGAEIAECVLREALTEPRTANQNVQDLLRSLLTSTTREQR